ncbi:MAG: hypothetical protein U9O98_00480 [Asgard group archaeon]|nr:hypothetical protein [Asgard group archaeon]
MNSNFVKNEKRRKTSKHLRKLRSDFVFCPKCGAKNIFSNAPPTRTIFFCQRCSTKISDYWEAYRNEKLLIDNCDSCGHLTFTPFRYCIFCGSLKEK